MNTVSYETVVADLEAHPAKRIFWRAGWAYRGAREREISRAPHEPKTVMKSDGSDGCRMVPTLIRDWKDELKACFRWACVVELDANTDAEMRRDLHAFRPALARADTQAVRGRGRHRPA